MTSSRARPPLVKGAAPIAPRGPHQLAPEAAPGASLHSKALSPECGRECPETGDRGPCRSWAMGNIGADCSWAARTTTPGPPPQPHDRVRLGLEASRFPHFWGRGSEHVPRFPGAWSFGAS